MWAVVLIWGIALVTSSFHTAFANITPDAGTVYCPLQKRLVPKIEPKAPAALITTEYCASPRETEEFTTKLVQNVGVRSVSNQDDVDSLFFAYKANGVRAFRGLSGTPDDPKAPFASDQSKNAVTSASFQVTSGALATEYLATIPSVSSVHAHTYFDVGAHSSIEQYISDPQRGPPAN